MIQRIGLGLALSTCVMMAACLGETTSLGSAQGSQASAGSGDDADDASAPETSDDGGVGLPTSGRKCMAGSSPGGYSWGDQTPTVEGGCTYLLPSPPPGNNEPNYDPATWDPLNVRVTTAPKNIGYYFSDASECGDYLGWTYGDSRSEAGSPTEFVLCPASCKAAAKGGLLMLDAICP